MTPHVMFAARAAVVSALMLGAPAAMAGPAEDANAVVDRWAAAYRANDVDSLTALYAPDAVLLGTTSPIISEHTDGIREYFKDLPGSGRRNAITDRRPIVLGDGTVVVTGFYEFFRREQPDMPRPSRFNMVLARHGEAWTIVHHHSSPRAATRL